MSAAPGERDPLRIAFLGSPGSFSEEAAVAHAARAEREPRLRGAPLPAEVLALVAAGHCERAVLPVVNTTGGLVRPALDALGSVRLAVLDEVVLTIRFGLFVRPGVALESVETVVSHPQGLRQCARTLARLLPGRATRAWSDTASAARDLAAGVLDERVAVLASARAGALHALSCLARDVQDEADNRTFFAVLGRGPGVTIE